MGNRWFGYDDFKNTYVVWGGKKKAHGKGIPFRPKTVLKLNLD